MKRIAIACIVLSLSLLLAPLCRGEDDAAASKDGTVNPTVPADKPSVDDQLIKDLDNDLLEGLDEIPTPTAPTEDKLESSAPGKSKLDQRLEGQLGEGEDVELVQPADPLTQIGKQMRAAEQLILKKDTSAKTQRLQQEISDKLAALIVVQRKRAQSMSQQRQPRPRSGRPSQGDQPGEEPMGDDGPQKSTERVGKPEETAADAAANQRLMRDVWEIHLPARLREQLRSAGIDRFLPKYQRLIEEYFQRLAEDRDDR